MAQVRGLSGPQLHASQVYRQVLAGAQRAGYLRGVKTPPPLVFGAPPGIAFTGQPAYAQAYVGRSEANSPYAGAIGFSPSLVSDLTSPGNRDYGLGVIVHELAHTRQNRSALSNPAWTEGGADAFARVAATPAIRASGLTQGFYPGAEPYTPLVQAVRDAFTKRWIMQGQFTPGANYSRMGPPLPPNRGFIGGQR